MPTTLQRFYSLFPLHMYEQEQVLPTSFFFSNVSPEASEAGGYQVEDIAPDATLFIHPPSNPNQTLLSSDIECVKWQAYLALRGIPGGVKVRWDLANEGAVGGRLPNLFLPVPKRLAKKEKSGEPSKARMRGELLEGKRIPSWVDGEIGKATGGEEGDEELEGYKDKDAQNEGKAWIALLEGDVHAVFTATAPTPSILTKITSFDLSNTREKPILSTTFTGVSSMIPPFGSTAALEPILGRYKETIEALSVRLSHDRWFLGSRNGTALDAIVFSYLFAAMESSNTQVREEVCKWANLVAWEKRVRKMVENATSLRGSV